MNITIDELDSLIPNINIIDIRDNYQYNLGHIPTAINVPMNFLMMNASNCIDVNKVYYIYCDYGIKSNKTMNKLVKDGYSIINIVGGYNSYKAMLHDKKRIDKDI